MSFDEMSIPQDLPWKRMGVSKDMMDQVGGDLKFPKKQISSISVFYHEPTELPPEYCDRKITYIKVVCTLSNYQISGKDVSVLNELKSTGDFFGKKEFLENVTRSYPCYGALVQVGVYPTGMPEGGTVEIHNYPYISTFQPQKREMYELTTQSGEIASQSSSKLNVTKGTTNIDSHDDYDMNLGGGGGSIGWGLFSATGDNVQQGTIDRTQNQKQDIRNTDTSRDKRESHSFSTNINQLYTLLQGFHLGTNRCMFFIEPRPHIQDSKFTFIRGLRRLEGIQEFFLVVNRPSSVPGICVEVTLETAHMYSKRAYKPKIIPYSELFAPGNLEKTPEALGIDVHEDNTTENWWYKLVDNWNLRSTEARYAASEPTATSNVVPAGVSHLTWLHMLRLVSYVPEIGIEQAALIFEEYESNSGTFFVTGRRLYCCNIPQLVASGTAVGNVDSEGSAASHVSTVDGGSASIPYWKKYLGRSNVKGKFLESMNRGIELNQMVGDLNDTLNASLSSIERFPYGEVSFLQTDFILDELSELLASHKIVGIKDQSLAQTPELRSFIQRGIGRESKVRTLFDLSKLTTDMIARDVHTTAKEARKIRQDLLISSLKMMASKSTEANMRGHNPIQVKYRIKFNNERLQTLIKSAIGGRNDKARSPKKIKTKRHK